MFQTATKGDYAEFLDESAVEATEVDYGLKNRSKLFWGISDLGNTIHGVGSDLAVRSRVSASPKIELNLRFEM